MSVSKIQIINDLITNIILREDHVEIRELKAVLNSRISSIELYFHSIKKDVEFSKSYYDHD